MESGQYIGRLATGEPVILGGNGHFLTHAAATPELLDLVVESLTLVRGGDKFIATDVDLGRVVGVTACVPTTDGDDIVFARRPNRYGLTRFVRGRQPVSTRHVSLIIKADGWDRLGGRPISSRYDLLSGWVGRKAPHEPWDRYADPAVSIPFWSSHALVWGLEETIPGTETAVCPW